MAHPTARRWLKISVISVAALVVALIALLAWLLATPSGLRFALARVSAATDGQFSVGSVHGRLIGPFHLTEVRYAGGADGLSLSIDKLDANPDLWAILSGTLRIKSLAVDGVTVTLPTSNTEPTKPSGPLNLQPPLNIELGQATITRLHIRQGKADVFDADRIAVAGAWTGHGLKLRELKLHAPAGHVELAGQVTTGSWRGQAHGQFDWHAGGQRYAGKLTVNSNGHTASLALTTSQPTTASIKLALQRTAALPWTLHVTIPAFNTQPLLGDSALKRLGLTLDGHGNQHGGTITGTVALNGTTLKLQPLELVYDRSSGVLDLKQLVLTSPQIGGEVQAHGSVALNAQPLGGQLALTWQSMTLPKAWTGQALATSGQIQVTGNLDAYHAQGKFTTGTATKITHVSLDANGTQTGVTLSNLQLDQPHGHLAAHGQVGFKPRLDWDITANAKTFNPGLILAGWPGTLSFALTSKGHMDTSGIPAGSLDIAKLDGSLRHRSVSGHGRLRILPGLIANGDLSLASGHSHIRIRASGEHSNNIRLTVGIVALSDWLPNAKGALHGDVVATGLWPHLAIRANLAGDKLAVADTHVGQIHLTARIPDITKIGGDIQVKARAVTVHGLNFKSVKLDGSGTAARHQVKLVADGQPLTLHLALSGAVHGKDWKGQLTTLDLALHGASTWRLTQPATISWGQGQAKLTRTCLSTGGNHSLCVAADTGRNGTLSASYTLRGLPLALIQTLANPNLPLTINGELDGNGKIERTAQGQFIGHAQLTSATGSIAYPDAGPEHLLAWHDFQLKADLTATGDHVQLSAGLPQGGTLNGAASISGPQQALAGQIAIHLTSLAPIALFTTAVANVKGRLDGQMELAGTLAKPILSGHVNMSSLAAEIPALGLKLNSGEIALNTTSDGTLQVNGHIRSGKGTLTVTGNIATGPQPGLALTISGKNVTAADIPAAEVAISPDLKVKHDDHGLAITGSIDIDHATVKLEDLPGAGTAHASDDVVIVDQPKAANASPPVPVTINVLVRLGHDAHIQGYGLHGSISGQLDVQQVPGRTATGRGQIVINGTYKAYGQNLHIRHGQLLFAGTPLDNPGLDIRAVRPLNPNATISDHQEVGLQISGTARRPIMTVFSNPAMDSSDALSYLITGKPLSAVRGGEGNMVDAAAQALGSATGDLLAKTIGARLGLDASVGSNQALGTTSFTVGKYLSPTLYLSYGVGLFEPGQVVTLRYILSRRWNFEAEQATTFSRASFNYRIQR